MKRFPLYALLLAMPFALAAASPEFKSRDARNAYARYERSLADAKQAYTRAVDRAEQVYREQLRAAQEHAMRAGNVEEIKRINDALAALAPDKENNPEAEPNTHPALARALAGTRWGLGSGWIVLNKNGTITTSYGDPAGVWRTRPNGETVMAFGRDVGRTIQTYTFTRDGRAATAIRLQGGQKTVWIRTPD